MITIHFGGSRKAASLDCKEKKKKKERRGGGRRVASLYKLVC